jgi:uncharacterized spore protein YtfJ
MTDTLSDALSLASQRDQQLTSSMEKIFEAAQASAVFTEPVVNGNYTVICACEVVAAGGFGSGLGVGVGTATGQTGEQAGEASQSQSQPTNGAGGGIGAGGFSRGRPIAAIVVGPDGVTIKPIIDVTSVALAGIGLWSGVVAIFRKRAKSRKG